MTGDPIQRYLADLRARLRTPDAELVIAEAEDHLRESVAAGMAIGMTGREAQEAAISAFGPVRAVVSAHRRPAAAAAEVAMEVWKLAAIYLLAVPVADLALTTFVYGIVRLHTVTPSPVRYSLGAPISAPSAVGLVAGLCASAIAGLVLLLGYRRVRRFRRRRGQPARAPLGGFFPLVAAIFMLFAGPTAAALIAPHIIVSWSLKMLAAAGVVASVLVALSYAAAMAMTLARQRRDRGTTDQGARYAG